MAKYEYSVMVQPIELKAGAADATGDELTVSLGNTMLPLVGKLGEYAEKLPPGGWELVSHDLTRIDRHLLLSFLLRREI